MTKILCRGAAGPAERKAIPDSDVSLNQVSYTYDGTEKKPEVTVKCDGVVLTKDTDYTVDYANNVSIEMAKATVVGIGNYKGTVTKEFTIAKADEKDPVTDEKKTISDSDVSLSKTSYAYDGKAKKPGVTVRDGKTVLKKGTDYTVAYKGNVSAGTAKAIVAGKGGYKGSVTKTFKIAVKKGTSHKVGSYQYKVTGASTAELTAWKDEKAVKVKVLKEVKIGGKKFKVTAIGKNAF